MPWLNTPLLRKGCSSIDKVLGVFHEPKQQAVNLDSRKQFDLNLCPDSALTYNSRYKEIPRIVFDYPDLPQIDDEKRFKIVTSGFPFPDKQLPKIIDAVNAEFTEEVLIQMHLPIHPSAKQRHIQHIEQLKRHPRKSNVDLRISSDFLSMKGLIYFLSQSDLACYFYRVNQQNSGSSSIDTALSARIPIAVTNFSAFNPFIKMAPEIVYNAKNNNLRTIATRGTKILEPMYEKWKPAKFTRRMEDLILNEDSKPNLEEQR
jgi:hypothetical protein